MSEDLTLREAAEKLDVHYMTVYRWVRLGVLPAHRRGRSWLVTSADLDLVSGHASPSTGPVSRRSAAWHERLTNRLLAGDRLGSWKVVEAAMTAGMTPLQVYHEMFTPALRAIGDRWESGDGGVDEEHQASVILWRLIGRMGHNFSTRGRQKGTVVLAAPPGERHALGLAMAADVLRSGGYGTLDLGADTPVGALESALMKTNDPTAVCLGVLDPAMIEALRPMVLTSRRLLPRTSPIVLGGSAIRDDAHARTLGADRKADLTTVIEAVSLGRETQPTVQV